ncbi:MAG: glycosyltransferase [bacterium]
MPQSPTTPVVLSGAVATYRRRRRIDASPPQPELLENGGEAPWERARPRVSGKFFFRGDEKLYVRGVTYGTFAPDEHDCPYPHANTVARDFGEMCANGMNTLRTYTVPPRWLLDLAHERGMLVMVGLPWEQHIAFLDRPGRADAIEQRVRSEVRSVAGHPALLCFAIGNEIPSSIVRWHGARRVERFLERLYRAVKDEDPEALCTYVNFPSTEYLDLPFLDFLAYNVYLESRHSLRAYIARLQNLAGERPLLMAEVGLDSRRNGEARQAEVLDWQVRTAFEKGCAGTIIFSFTDEWHRGGHDVDDWDFGLLGRCREPKAALTAVKQAFATVPFPMGGDWPRISIVVCTYNGARTLTECLTHVRRIDYPDFELIVVDDGSTDLSAAIADSFGARVIRTPNRGLSSARNAGMHAATGEIIAYLDDDAYPDRDWLRYLAHTFRTTNCAGVGGPNIAPPGDGRIAECVAHAPGGPSHVLVSDEIAEHIPGCNAAFRKDRLEAIGGFDPQFRTAGDDVDVCWRLQARGWRLGFNPAAVVWHHRRNAFSRYWRQQTGYGEAEAMLERKWPEKYNTLGHLRWEGRLYARGVTPLLPFQRSRIYHGSGGFAPFQSVYQPGPTLLHHAPMMPEWHLLTAFLGALSLASMEWAGLRFAIPLFAAAVVIPLGFAAHTVRGMFGSTDPRPRRERFTLRALTGAMHAVQPVARLWGRLSGGLHAWRRTTRPALTLPRSRVCELWSERWRDPSAWLSIVEENLEATCTATRRGGDFDSWDLEAQSGVFTAVRALLGLEEHGAGRQLVRIRLWARATRFAVMVVAMVVLSLVATAAAGVWALCGVVLLTGVLLVLSAFNECEAALAAFARTLSSTGVGTPALQEPQPIVEPTLSETT